jgi:hypothetical protein
MFTLKVAKRDQGLAIIFTDEAAAALRVAADDVLRAEPDETGGVRLFGPDPGVAEEVAIGESLMNDYRGTLRALAK